MLLSVAVTTSLSRRPLTQLLLETAQAQGVQVDGSLTAAKAFELVREMPYRRASGRDPATTIREWRGTCSGKHYLLKALLAELRVPSTLIACTTYVSVDPARLPAEIAAVLLEGPVPDVHNYLRLPWIVDATWPVETREYGVPVNPTWLDGEDMLLPCTPIAEHAVPEGVEPQAFKDELLRNTFTVSELERRSRFFKLLAGA